MDLASLRTRLVELLLLSVLGVLPVTGRWDGTRLRTGLLGLLGSRCIMLKSSRESKLQPGSSWGCLTLLCLQLYGLAPCGVTGQPAPARSTDTALSAHGVM